MFVHYFVINFQIHFPTKTSDLFVASMTMSYTHLNCRAVETGLHLAEKLKRLSSANDV